MHTGELVRLAPWCKNGPAIMEVLERKLEPCRSYVKVIFLEGPELGRITDVHMGNIFTLEDYDDAVEKHYENR